MKYLKQFVIIILICLVGEVVVSFLPFGFPGNVMAMIILSVLLVIRVIKEEHIQETSNFLLEAIGLFILPVSVGMIAHLGLIQTIGFQLLLISLITLVLTFASCAFTIRLTMKIMNRKKKEKV
ncbi:MAG: CidA/LrgA family protein [Defluviitaleaceae bacterium]|nr:CidA/LrgA family protein [Defluviitaleaceae bacterium]